LKKTFEVGINEGVNLLYPSHLSEYNINIKLCEYIIAIIISYTLFVTG